MKELKREYKSSSEKIKVLKSAIILIEQNIQQVAFFFSLKIKKKLIQCKNLLFSEFEKWFRKKYGISINDLDNPLINNKSDDGSENNDNDEYDPDALTYIKAKQKVKKKKIFLFF